MAIDSANESTASNIKTSSASASKLKFGQDFESFLKLLVAQLQNQDPLSPLESHEFTNQLVLFAGVEQQIRSNELSEELVNSEKQRQLTNGLNLIGKQVQYGDGYHEFDALGKIEYRFNAPEDVANVKIQIFDENRNLVTQVNTGEMDKGEVTFTWRGEVYSAEGRKTKTVDRGKFIFNILSAENKRGTDVPGLNFSPLDSSGVATGISLKNSEVLIDLQDGKQIALSKITEVGGNNAVEKTAEDTTKALTDASALVGRTVSYRSATVELKSGTAKFSYKLPGNADAGSVYVTDLEGRLIHSDTLSLSPTSDGKGTQSGSYSWNGTSYEYDADGKIKKEKDPATGKDRLVTTTAADGEYIFYLNNVKAGEKEIAKSAHQYDVPIREGKITSVELVDGKNLLYKIGLAPVLPESIIRVKESP